MVEKIQSFRVDHDFIVPGIYISRIDGDITTYDLRTKKPNCGDYMDDLTMHSVEHMFATYIRSSAIGDKVIYFGPMGCQTGFYLLVRGANHMENFNTIKSVLRQIVEHDGIMFGAERKECGNYLNLDLESAKKECRVYLEVLEATGEPSFEYPTK